MTGPFPGINELEMRQGSDFDETYIWYTDAPDEARFVGDWDATTAFARNDMAVFAGELYAASSASTGEEPDTSGVWVLLTPMNLTGFTARMMARRSFRDPAPTLSLTSTPLADGSGLTLGGTAGTIRLKVGHATTALLPDTVLQYDIELVAGAGGNVTPFMAGPLIVHPEVTR